MTDREKGQVKHVLRLPIRYYQIDRLYGPGMPSCGREGLRQRELHKHADHVALVSVHCWNLGEADGPYPVGAQAHCPGEAADWVPTAHHIIEECIEPAMEAARRAGITVFHLAQPTYAPRYATYRQIAEDEELAPPMGAAAFVGCVRPHGSEPVIVDGWQLNGLCRRLDIDTLIYVGFMADLCLVSLPGAIREMSSKFGYRCVVLRDCTTAYEFADTCEGGYMTLAAIRLIETGLGYSATSQDFVGACNGAGAAT